MRLCRFDGVRLGVALGDDPAGDIADVSEVLDMLPPARWGRARGETPGDPLVARLDAVRARIEAILPDAPRRARRDVRIEAPVAAPTKIIGAPVNYHAHLNEAREDSALHQGRTVHPIDEIGCFLKANSALSGPDEPLRLPIADARVDHEAEVAVIVGRAARDVCVTDAMDHVAGYALALDMTVRGKQDRSMRKSCDGFAVLGPWLVTADAVNEPGTIPFVLDVDGEERQRADTSLLIRTIPELIAMCSRFYTLWPGDVIMTGTPAGVAPVVSGNRIRVRSVNAGRARGARSVELRRQPERQRRHGDQDRDAEEMGEQERRDAAIDRGDRDVGLLRPDDEEVQPYGGRDEADLGHDDHEDAKPDGRVA